MGEGHNSEALDGVGPDVVVAGDAVADDAVADDAKDRDRVVSIIEALLLAVVAVLAAWSGYSSAKWSTESRLDLARASTARTEASQNRLDAQATKDYDASTFDAWFTAFVAANQPAMNMALQRFRPDYKVAFDAWLATDPANNSQSPPGPTSMSQYKEPDLKVSVELDKKADELYESGAKAGQYADNYVRTTVYLATVLFLIGISGHFRFKTARIGLIVVGSAILTFSIILLVTAPKPPT